MDFARKGLHPALASHLIKKVNASSVIRHPAHLAYEGMYGKVVFSLGVPYYEVSV